MAGEPEIQRIARLTPLADVLARIESLVAPVAPRAVDASDAMSRVLAEDATAAAALPAEACALLDGYAVRSDEVADASPYSPVPLAVAPVRVDVGDVMPPGADAVVPVDAIASHGGRIEAVAPATAGDGVLPARADIASGGLVAKAGWRLTDLNIAMLAATGHTRIVVREPQVRLVTARREPDGIVTAAADLLARALTARGCALRRNPIGLDDALADSEADAVIAIGGTGSGRNDDSVLVLARRGRVEAHGVAISPGETAAFGMCSSRPVLLLPGRIDAVLAGWLMLGVPLTDRLAGSSDAGDASIRVPLARKVASQIGLAEVVPVRLNAGRAEPIASGYWPLGSLAFADGWILVPASSEGFAAGSDVVVKSFP